MKLKTTEPMDAFLQSDRYVDFDNAAIQELVRELQSGQSETELVRDIYEFVRDRIAHSWDIQATDVQATASEVLQNGHGICYAKSHLLAALLRAAGIPSGFCYQRLTLFDKPEDGHCVHALNTVYLSEHQKWIRLDARGNKPGVDARFSLDEEKLAFPVRKIYDEVDYETNFAVPPAPITDTLESFRDGNGLEMYLHGLPAAL
ncbi:transglutaminase [Tumebacillus flagellatus]|uniref:Transglutaminase n=1 Tax=Tumebacillus flagellatus TaxID=1157490 RepID=A0A074LT37_9BACL|nr:transglutaminase [Tumebacillus flagellatus]